MVFELDDGVILVKPHGEARDGATNMDVPRCHFYRSSPDDALDGAVNWREPYLGSWH
jgi:hypothetical protein